MKNRVHYIIRFFLFAAIVTIIGCSSSEYDIDEYEVSYNEKTINVDTIKQMVYDEDSIKDNKNNNDSIKDVKKDSYTYIVQIGAFMIKSNFDQFFASAQRILGSDVYFDFTNNLYKIRIGSFSNRADAILMLDKMLSIGYTDAFIVTHKNK